MGFSVPPRLRLERWALTPPFHPCLLSLAKLRRFNFLWHCPSAGLAAWPPACIPDTSGLRSIAPCGVRTFLPRLAPGAVLHPSKIKANLVWYLRNSYKFVALKLAWGEAQGRE